MKRGHVAVDLGAESGRIIVGILDEERISLQETCRFPNRIVQLPTGLHWDITGLWREIVGGLKKTSRWLDDNGVEALTIGVDTWGVDWALLTTGGDLSGLPHAYRDPRNAAAFQEVLDRIGASTIYQTTGIQLMQINTLFSLYAQLKSDAQAVHAADRLLFIPDLLHYWLSGRCAVELTIASTSQMLNVATRDWDRALCEAVGIPPSLLHEIVPPATALGPIRSELATATRLSDKIQVVVPASHDTGSAVAAVPARPDTNWAFISSGTWSLLGAELDEPCVNQAAEQAMFTNELGVGGTVRFLKNIAGLWLVQQCRQEWLDQGQEFTYADLTRRAESADAFRTLVHPDWAPFALPGDMLNKINQYARSTGQPECETPGQFVRCCLESLAFAYRRVLLAMESVLDRQFDVVHIVGGGGQNTLLNQLTANAIGRPVIVGPFEATAMGNALVQAMADGTVRDLAHLREMVRHSFDLITVTPHVVPEMEQHFVRFESLPLEA